MRGKKVAGLLAGAVMLGGVQVTASATQAQASYKNQSACDYISETIDYLAVEGQRLISEGKEQEGLLKLSRIPGWEADLNRCLQQVQEHEEIKSEDPSSGVDSEDTGSTGRPVSPTPAPSEPATGAPNVPDSPEPHKHQAPPPAPVMTTSGSAIVEKPVTFISDVTFERKGVYVDVVVTAANMVKVVVDTDLKKGSTATIITKEGSDSSGKRIVSGREKVKVRKDGTIRAFVDAYSEQVVVKHKGKKLAVAFLSRLEAPAPA